MKNASSTVSLIALALLPRTALADAEAAPAAEYEPPLGTLIYPVPGATEVAPGTLLFASNVTALELEGPGAERLAAPIVAVGSRMGSVFEPMDVLSAGTWRVLALPSPETANWAGEGVLVELATITVAAAEDTEAPVVVVTDAEWTVGDAPGNVTVTVAFTGHVEGDPVLFEVDLGDRDTALDGTPDASNAWTTGDAFTANLGEVLPQIEPESAIVRIRALDASGNVGPWSEEAPFTLRQTTLAYATGCRTAPGHSDATPRLALLFLLGTALLVRRRRQRQGSSI